MLFFVKQKIYLNKVCDFFSNIDYLCAQIRLANQQKEKRLRRTSVYRHPTHSSMKQYQKFNWTFVVDKWTQGKAWAREQPRWKLGLYGIGAAIAAGVAMVMLLMVMIALGLTGPLPTYGELSSIRNHQASSIYSEDGVVLGKYYIENRNDVRTDEISPLLIHALIATEDARFFEHGGIDLRALARVLVKSILFQDESSGGGSTLSQQLAKNLYPRKKYWLLGMPINKIREMFVARRLEKIYDKDALLALYLNTVPFGENAFGIKVAANRFFKKSPEQLRVEEAATLVGMLKATSLYNPRKNEAQAIERRNTVLHLLARDGHIPAEKLDSLCQLPIRLDFQAEGHEEGTATYFREHLRQEILEILKDYKKADGTPYNVYTDGLKIYTTIDSRMQRYAEAAVASQLPAIQARFKDDWGKRTPWTEEILDRVWKESDRYKDLKARGRSDKAIRKVFDQPTEMTIFDWQKGAVDTTLTPMDSLKHYLVLLNVGLLSAEPSTGLIRAWVGGGAYRFIQYDHVKSKRPVGSTFKPVVYAAALQSGMLPCEYTPNVLTRYDEYKGWEPQNSDGKYGGAYSMAGAMSNSVNTVAVQLALRAGVKNVARLGRDMGIESPIPNEPAIALGAVDASLLDMVMAYSTLANRGNRLERLHYLDRIETADGELIVAFKRPSDRNLVKILETDHADMMLHFMQQVIDRGTGSRVRGEFGITGTLMGKTGTTQEQGDGWFMGFNSRLVTGVWIGAEQSGIHFRTLSNGQAARTALPVFGAYLSRVYQNNAFKSIRNAAYPAPSDTVSALLQCPHFLDDMPLSEDDYEVDEEPLGEDMDEWNKTVAAMDEATLNALMLEFPRRDEESLGRYARRILRKFKRMQPVDDAQGMIEEDWESIFFSKKKEQ